jgi:GNAT superfamily N-acetyltransferase
MKLFKMQSVQRRFLLPAKKNEFFVVAKEGVYYDDPAQEKNCLDLLVYKTGKDGEIDTSEMIGFAEVTTTDVTKVGELNRMFVAKEYQNQKIGQQLLDMRTEYAKNKGCTQLKVTLIEDEDIEKRQRFFKRNGFEMFGDHKAWKTIFPSQTPTNKFLPSFDQMQEFSMSVKGLEKQKDQVRGNTY